MLTEICAELKNYFCREEDIIIGDFAIIDGAVTPSFSILDGQYYRIVGSVFNDGVHKFGDETDTLTDEPKFHGGIWPMRIPAQFLSLVDEITAWQGKYGNVDSQNMSPYSSESFGGYSYSKSSGYNASGENGGGISWRAAFSSRLKPYRRIRVL